jgi:peptidase E
MESSSTSTFIPKARQERQREKLVEVMFEFLQQNLKVSDLVMSDDKQSSEDLAQQLDEISTPPICCTAEAEAQEDYVEKLYELLSEHGLQQATWEFCVRSDQREFHQAFIAAVDLQHELHYHRPPGANMVGSYIAQDSGEA